MKVLRALAHPLRLEILQYLYERENGACVTEIYQALGVDQTVASQQLRILREVELVYWKRFQVYRYYYVDKEWLEAVSVAVKKYMP